jgi:catechol 2,3-dioxygenase-like lactoylglutathione lyase family enzyme
VCFFRFGAPKKTHTIIKGKAVNRIHVITLGVEDINRSLKFYRDGLGFVTTVAEEDPPIVFFQSEGVTLALCPKEGLAEDIEKEDPPEGTGFSGTTLGYVVKEKDAVDHVLSLAEQAGARIVKSSQWTFWGGYHGYFSDPDGYYWEVMYWEGWKFKADGALKIE